ncbi:enoyl-CoA hydratase-related protein [Dactylosporangium sucinum]|uniref:Enoyl-CoA hydratase n=1 Tax=Dactylosporangium sucinum TaxID=1424081 RepID=A0A917UAG7_9ACTN|nr:enoyl-CoA hydratase-related protein [Dactylosporangium sucinum]GGM64691.1 enoyl-CoA hydratase [Dactylosporangium sucinum]
MNTGTAETAPVLVEWHDDVALVTMHRPAKRNALSRAMAEQLTAAMRSCQEAGAIVLTGADPAFCAGMDLAEADKEGYITPSWIVHTFYESVVPLVAAVNGPAITAGLEIALAADFILASERAVFADTHGLVGAVPGGGITVHLAERTTTGFARQMSLTGMQVDSATALRTGLANEVYPHAELLPAALGVGRRIAAMPRAASRAVKRMYDEVDGLRMNAGLERERELFAAFTATSAADFAGFHRRIRSK